MINIILNEKKGVITVFPFTCLCTAGEDGCIWVSQVLIPLECHISG